MRASAYTQCIVRDCFYKVAESLGIYFPTFHDVAGCKFDGIFFIVLLSVYAALKLDFPSQNQFVTDGNSSAECLQTTTSNENITMYGFI